jgi:hypothetical protein
MKPVHEHDTHENEQDDGNRGDYIKHGNRGGEVSFEFLFSEFRFPEFPFWIDWIEWELGSRHDDLFLFPLMNVSHGRDMSTLVLPRKRLLHMPSLNRDANLLAFSNFIFAMTVGSTLTSLCSFRSSSLEAFRSEWMALCRSSERLRWTCDCSRQ